MFALILALTLLAATRTQLQSTAYDDISKKLIGVRDDFKVDTRIDQPNQRTTISDSFNDYTYYLKNLGLKDWGVIQISALMTEYPDLTANNAASPLCSVSTDTTSLNKKSEFKIENDGDVYDFEVYMNSILMLTTKGKLIQATIDSNGSTNVDEDQRSTGFSDKYTSKDLKDFVKTQNITSFSEAGMAAHPSQQVIYIPTDTCLMVVQLSDLTTKIVAKGVYEAHSDLTYTDVIDDLLFVGFKNKGVYVYSIQDQTKISKIGVMDANFFERTSGKEFAISEFAAHNHFVEITSASILDFNYKPWHDKQKFIFTNEDTMQKYIDIMNERNKEESLMFIAEAEAIFVVDLSKIRDTGSITGSLLPHKIAIPGVSKLRRFDGTLYALQINIWQPDSGNSGIRSTISEIFILDRKSLGWGSPRTNCTDLFSINRKVDYIQDIQNIYVDDVYFYAIGLGEHFFYERGVPAEYGYSSYGISQSINEPDVNSMVKFIIDGYSYLITIGKSHLADFKMIRIDPHIRCPAFEPRNNPYGKYKIELNVTTRMCPAKADMMKDITDKSGLLKLCRWSTTLELDYYHASIAEDTHTLRFLVIFMLIVIALCCVVFIYFIHHARQKSIEYERLKLEIGNFKLPTNPDIQSARELDENKESDLANHEDVKMNKQRTDDDNEDDTDKVDYGNEA